MSIDFHRLMEPIDINRLIFIDYIDYIDCFPMIDFHRLDPSGLFCTKNGWEGDYFLPRLRRDVFISDHTLHYLFTILCL